MQRRNKVLEANDYAVGFAERMIDTGLVPWGSLETITFGRAAYACYTALVANGWAA